MEKAKHTYIGHSTDETVRYKASSGGVGSSVVKYMLDTGEADYALSFTYDPESISYIPHFVSKFEDYSITGSIYQEMNVMSALKQFLEKFRDSGNIKQDDNLKPTAEDRKDIVKGRIILFSLPCQAKALRTICRNAGFEAIIIGLTCSSQQSKEATSYLLSRLGINEDEVSTLQYRGNGWPSGIQIKTKSGKEIFVNNNDSIWTEIFHSRLFIQKRCFNCNNTLNDYADIVLADPWLKDYMSTETIGQTLFATYTRLGEKYIEKAIEAKYVKAKEVSYDLLYNSQKPTIIRKEVYNSHPAIRKWFRRLFLSNTYRFLVRRNVFFLLHCRVKDIIESRMTKKVIASNSQNI